MFNQNEKIKSYSERLDEMQSAHLVALIYLLSFVPGKTIKVTKKMLMEATSASGTSLVHDVEYDEDGNILSFTVAIDQEAFDIYKRNENANVN